MYIFLISMFFSVLFSLQDLKNKKVSNILLWTGILVLIIFRIFYHFNYDWKSVLAAFCFGLFYFLVRLITKKKLGIADVYFGVFQGLCLDFRFYGICVLLEVLLALIIMNKKLKQGDFPFIPFMALSLNILLCFCLFGETLWK